MHPWEQRLSQRRVHGLMAAFVVAWCIPLLATGSRMDRNDFSMFCQGYEAIRLSVLHYHQFPWMNPWVSGGAPLYADPQLGVFSVQTLLVFIFGAPIGLKVAVCVYSLAGYASMSLLLQRYFRVHALLAAPLSLLWICSSFFVAHIPNHFTFVWYLVAPLYIYLSLTAQSWRGGILLGLAFSVMLLSAIHDASLFVTVVCVLILLVRIVRTSGGRRGIITAVALAGLIVIALVGHRAWLTIQYALQYSHAPDDPAPSIQYSLLGFLVPYTRAHSDVFSYEPPTRYFWFEMTATMGVIFNALFFGSTVLFVGRWREQLTRSVTNRLSLILLLALVVVTFGIGSVAPFAPYALLKHLPIFSGTRIATRLYVFLLLLEASFVGVVGTALWSRSPQIPRIFVALLSFAIAENAVLNFGYQEKLLKWTPVKSPKHSWDQPFAQVRFFGQDPDGRLGSAAAPPAPYREYEATAFNIGVLRANNAVLFDAQDQTALCATSAQCPFVLSRNAVITYWSPNKVRLSRTGPGPVQLDMNDSLYWVVNGIRQPTKWNADVQNPFTAMVTDTTSAITLETSPEF